MSDTIVIESDDEFTVIELAEQGPPGPSGSSVPATTTSLGGVIVGGGLSVITSGNATTNGTLSTNATLIGLGSVDNTPDLAKPISSLTQTALDGKALVNHNHTIANITGLQAALDGKQSTGNYVLTSDSRLSDARTPLAHTHVISDTTGLQTALDAKLPTANFTYANLPGTPNLSVYYLATNPAGYITASCLTWSNTTGKPTFATVATSGLYSDLSGTPNLSLYYLASNPAGYITASCLTYSNITGTPNLSLYLTVSTAASTYAPLASPSLTGTPTAPTAANGTATTQVATTAFVANATANAVTLSNSAGVDINATGGTSGSNAQAARADHTHKVGVAGVTLTWAASVTWNCNFLQTATLTLGGTTTLTASGHVAGGTYVLILKQDATGNRAVTWSGFKWASGTAPVISTSANAVDILTFVSDGTSLYGTHAKGFA
ncbi:Phage tail repeat like [uncultured Caudovirales phage]|uniref:Phage tail repeat like n=1 Tax=uncultured Caudovirales phage TaxID=2100421 RepID=A0A6J7WIE7_9CAUD|nr:Phage tail repeat like [uncultured Caudovirales phage]